MKKILTLLLLSVLSGHAVLIPPARVTDWTANVRTGVIGGIPNRTSPVINVVTSYGADNTGGANAAPQIQNAINAATPGSVVFLPAGTYRFDTPISIGSTKDNITLRGAGMGTTIIDLRAFRAIFIGSESDWNWGWPTGGQPVTGGLTKDSTVLTMADTSWTGVGQIVKVSFSPQQDNAIIQAGGALNWVVNGATNSKFVSQKCRVVAKTGTSLTIFPGIYHTPYAGQTALVNVAQAQTDNSGIEDLSIIGQAGNLLVSQAVYFAQTYNCWLKNVEIRYYYNYGLKVVDSLNTEVRHCKIADRTIFGSDGSGILYEGSSAGLIEDNIFYNSFANFQNWVGSNGYVFAHNVSENPTGYFAVLANHSTHPSFNLYEGNAVMNILSDGYFGSASEDTIFRNWIHGTNVINESQTYTIALKRFVRNFNIVGNVLGRSGVSGSIISYGQPNIGNGASTGTVQPTAGIFWPDWKMTGTLTTRTSDTQGVFTVNNVGYIQPIDPLGLTITIWWNNKASARSNMACVAPVSGNNITLGDWHNPYPNGASIITSGDILPPVGTVVQIYTGSNGAQALDLDVQASTIDKGNYSYVYPNGTPGSMTSLGGDTLPSSLFRSAKPAYFGNLAWPPFDPTDPNAASYLKIPAGYRWINGVDPPSGTPDTTAPTLSTKVINAAGNQLTLTFNEAVMIGAGGNAGWTLAASGGAAGLSYLSGATSSALVYTITGRAILPGETVTVSYTQPVGGNGIEDTGGGNDLASLTNSSVTNGSTVDVVAPTPNPASFSAVPAPVDSLSVTMTATTGSDVTSPPVAYFFDETSGNSGGSDSGWIASPTYVDAGLTPNTAYTYRVKIRDNVLNETAYSSTASATTLPTAVGTVNIETTNVQNLQVGAP